MDARHEQTGDGDDARVDRAELLAWLTASCARQGVPVVISDPGVIAQAAALLGGGPASEPAGQSSVVLDAPSTAPPERRARHARSGPVRAA